MGLGNKVLELKNLRTIFRINNKELAAVDDVSFDLYEGQTLGLVGESGCGKSVTSLSIIQLVPSPPGEFAAGEILFENRNLLRCSAEEIRRIRGNKISMIFQEPMTSLNPVHKIGKQLMEVFVLHKGMTKNEAYDNSIEILRKVGIPEPDKRMANFPHHLSGGMRQRIMIAMALASKPKILIADEPTTALDVTIQAQILELINELRKELGMAVLMITHDLGVVAETCDYVNVMYAGQIVEKAEVGPLFAKPLHPYTEGLLKSIPKIATQKGAKRNKRLDIIPGIVPDIADWPKGCRFASRCQYKQDICIESCPKLRDMSPGRRVACHFPIKYR